MIRHEKCCINNCVDQEIEKRRLIKSQRDLIKKQNQKLAEKEDEIESLNRKLQEINSKVERFRGVLVEWSNGDDDGKTWRDICEYYEKKFYEMFPVSQPEEGSRANTPLEAALEGIIERYGYGAVAGVYSQILLDSFRVEMDKGKEEI